MTTQEIIQTATLEVRSQHSVGSGGGNFGGPDTYIAVQIAPASQRLRVLRQNVAKRRGIRIIVTGEGYRNNQGNRSMYGRALDAAIAIKNEWNTRADAAWTHTTQHAE
jgi:hypothetical protein